MKNIGESFSFYAKYCAEMDMLYSSEDKVLLDDMDNEIKKNIEQKINCIGDQASVEAADFLEVLTKVMVECLEDYCGAKGIRKRRKMKDDWDTEIQVWPGKKSLRPQSWDHTMGASLINSGKELSLVIWAWCKDPHLSSGQVVSKYKNFFPEIALPPNGFTKNTIQLGMISFDPEMKGSVYSIDEDKFVVFSRKVCTNFAKNMLKDYLKNYAG